MKRTVIAEGDSSHVVTRVAKKYRCSARIRTETGESLTLVVGPTGEWELLHQGGAFEPVTRRAFGRLGPIPHTQDGSWCECPQCKDPLSAPVSMDCNMGHDEAGEYHTQECDK